MTVCATNILLTEDIVTTRVFKTGNATMFDDAVDILIHHQFENRLTTNDTERTRRAYI